MVAEARRRSAEHYCPSCGEPTYGTWSDGELKWATCERCTDEEREDGKYGVLLSVASAESQLTLSTGVPARIRPANEGRPRVPAKDKVTPADPPAYW
jgi:hypothetical protein